MQKYKNLVHQVYIVHFIDQFHHLFISFQTFKVTNKCRKKIKKNNISRHSHLNDPKKVFNKFWFRVGNFYKHSHYEYYHNVY